MPAVWIRQLFRLAQLVPQAINKLITGNSFDQHLPCQFFSVFILILLFCKVTSQITFELTNYVTNPLNKDSVNLQRIRISSYQTTWRLLMQFFRNTKWTFTFLIQVHSFPSSLWRSRASREVSYPTKHFWRIFLELRQNVIEVICLKHIKILLFTYRSLFCSYKFSFIFLTITVVGVPWRYETFPDVKSKNTLVTECRQSNSFLIPFNH